MRKLSADLILTNTGNALDNAVLIVDESGVIQDIISNAKEIEGVEHFSGIITPGFVNAHCHLELSHLKDVIATGTGLIPFIKGVVNLRDFPQDVIDEAIRLADQEMWDNGIMAVGDISNQKDTIPTKSVSKLRYYTFVEMFDFLQEENAQGVFEQYREVFEAQVDVGLHKKSYVPHAPYSVSKTLFNYVNELNPQGVTVSIHNQELKAENELFLSKTGGFIDFYKDFSIDLSTFASSGKTSIHYILEHLAPKFKTLMVHNTMTDKQDIMFAHAWNQQTYWVTCPNANLYIENRLPSYDLFIDSDAKMCIGTDSLTSNWSLSILEEMRTIKKYQSFVPDELIVKWATLNGAKALGYDDLGYFEKGLSPGIIHIDVPCKGGDFDLSKSKGMTRIY